MFKTTSTQALKIQMLSINI